MLHISSPFKSFPCRATEALDPERRTLVQVRIEDAVEPDEIFTILMGDAVEPRRDFIESHALDVRHLDI
ncbi:MAG: hypothetical protein HY314_08765 [Acidobacteria bacterium]|nr:hypothetical protein [Acidobacteriota bacterium]